MYSIYLLMFKIFHLESTHMRTPAVLLNSKQSRKLLKFSAYAIYPGVFLHANALAVHPTPVSEMEMAFGLPGRAANVLLRNYMTFLLRECITDQERIAFHNKRGRRSIEDIKIAYNQRIKDDVNMKYNVYKHLDRLRLFEDVFAYKSYLLAWEQDEWQILTIFHLP